MKGSIAVGVLLSVIALLYVGIIEAALLLAMFIWVPMLLQLITQDPQIKVDRWLRRTSFVAIYFAIIASVSLFLPQSMIAGLFATVWLVFVAIIGVLGLLRQLRYGFQRSEEALINLSLMYLPIGGVWLVAGASGASQFLPYTDVIVWLTAIHFHYAAFFLPIVAGLYIRSRRQQIGLPKRWSFIAILLALGPIFVAIGIDQGPPLEFYVVATYAVGLFLFVGLWLVDALKRNEFTLKLRLTLLSASFVFALTTTWTLVYSFGLLSENIIVTIEWMTRYHGAVNASVFATLAFIVVWQLRTPSSVNEITVSHLRTRGYVGTVPIDEARWKKGSHTPTLVSNWDELANETFSPSDVDDEIRNFYTSPNRYKMVANVAWSSVFKPLLPVVHYVTVRFGQLNVPKNGKAMMNGAVIPLDSIEDGRAKPSVWLRWSEEAHIFTAIYSTVDQKMNIALPLPFGVMTGILQPETDQHSGLILNSEPNGIFYTIGSITIRLPLKETFHIKKVHNTELHANHHIQLFGLSLFTIEYELTAHE
ncbi:YndJ family protein [Geomicrobium sp. JCM 19038]|uniref:YndJ family protein n=1 Tax=Geomicrobium sp. JCM 19038 TaxID=1460635 RepID=UPI00045F2038|nr:YndJ family protein [Geomicrobium sp. JCM 19038]GAK06862.1 hypothetical protein JCM19038_572 [Geomicrobium sp. JCM 19038]